MAMFPKQHSETYALNIVPEVMFRKGIPQKKKKKEKTVIWY